MRKKEKKKPSCLGKVIKVFLYFVVFLMLIGIFGGSDETTTDTPAPKVTAVAVTKTPEATAAPTQAPTSAPEIPVQPSIAGSQVYDIVLSLEDKGIPKAKTQTSSDAAGRTIYQHASSGWDDSSMLSYNITSNHGHVVSYAVFNVSDNKAPWYLPFCATMPYASADPEKAAQFVKDNMKKEATTQIGDAIFAITPNKNGGAMLTITAVGYEEWCLDQLM